MSPSVRRHALGIVALVLLAAAAVLHVGFAPSQDENLARFCRDSCLRIGMTMGAAWLAFPQIMALTAYCSPRLLLTLAIGLVVVIVQRRAFPFVAAMVAAVIVLEVLGWMLKPLRSSDKPPKHRSIDK
jgi:hypothetical protein